ncbi:Gamma-glutamylcyclotransferase [Mycena venus]|uniref:glutathione-specific gamma-glutamylcyclotransferase n=1 Tax=Mycena venus TaxID=2733690 RepID=A0A8H6XZG1_9AGAR|nr:Gamma-glutamylcyclotransferase [Mycena venus]
MSPTTVPPFVVFGYGSLIFKPPPNVVAQVPGFLKGYVRRFAQKSHDHRGTPENPGRVVTLVHKEDWDIFSTSDPFPDEDIVWGVAYTIDPEFEADVRAYLDYREKDGYTMESMPIYGVEDGVEKVIIPNVRSLRIDSFFQYRLSSCRHTHCYVGRRDNPSFIGSEPLPDLAHRIWISVGPSGPNKEYLYNLANAVRELSPESYDKHLFALEELVKALDGKSGISVPV